MVPHPRLWQDNHRSASLFFCFLPSVQTNVYVLALGFYTSKITTSYFKQLTNEPVNTTAAWLVFASARQLNHIFLPVSGQMQVMTDKSVVTWRGAISTLVAGCGDSNMDPSAKKKHKLWLMAGLQTPLTRVQERSHQFLLSFVTSRLKSHCFVPLRMKASR